MQWLGLLLDLALVAGLGRAFMRGSQVGLLRIVFDVVGLVAATIGGLLAYQHLSSWFTKYLHLPAVFGPLIAFGLIWLAAEASYIAILRFSPFLKPKHQRLASLSGLLAAIISSLNYLVVAGLSIVILAGLPLPTLVKSTINDSHISAAILGSTNQLQSELNRTIDKNIASTLNFLTIEPQEDNETIQLGYTVTNGKIRAELEAKMLVLVNQERTSRGLSVLKVNDKARVVARAHSQDMFARGYFSHITPEGVDPFKRMKAGNVNFLAAGENLALAPNLTLAHNGLMNSPPHRANILDPSYSTVGIGIIDGGRYGLMITQDYTN